MKMHSSLNMEGINSLDVSESDKGHVDMTKDKKRSSANKRARSSSSHRRGATQKPYQMRMHASLNMESLNSSSIGGNNLLDVSDSDKVEVEMVNDKLSSTINSSPSSIHRRDTAKSSSRPCNPRQMSDLRKHLRQQRSLTNVPDSKSSRTHKKMSG